MGSSIAAGTKLGRYEIVKHLATGGMADLLLARADGLEGFEHHVVIKRIRADQEDDQAFVDMFLAEARLAAVLHHHNIVQVHDIGQEQGKPYFAMEYVHGEDLRHLLHRLHERGEQLPLQHVITIATAVAIGLHHAHEQKGPDRKPLGIVHRDVTPANILVGYDGNVKVVDFGIARAAMRRTETQAGMLKGKAPYMAPEQCTGAKIDRRSDVFALGIVMYELATVRRLFKGENEFLTMSAIVKGTIPRPSTVRPDLPPGFDEIVMRALAREPAARYQTAEQLFNALDELAISSGIRTSATSLAMYMKQLFGERSEPWLEGGDVPAREVSVDFDGSKLGLIAAPTEAVDAQAIPKAVVTTKSAPIARARHNVITAASGLPAAIAPVGSAPVLIPAPAAPAPAPATNGRARTAPPAPVAAPRRGKPKTIQIPVTRVAEQLARPPTETAVLANPLATPSPRRRPDDELDDDAQLPKTAIVANPLASGASGEHRAQDTAIVANPLATVEQFGQQTDVLVPPLEDPPPATARVEMVVAPAPDRAMDEDTSVGPPAPVASTTSAHTPVVSTPSALPAWSRAKPSAPGAGSTPLRSLVGAKPAAAKPAAAKPATAKPATAKAAAPAGAAGAVVKPMSSPHVEAGASATTTTPVDATEGAAVAVTAIGPAAGESATIELSGAADERAQTDIDEPTSITAPPTTPPATGSLTIESAAEGAGGAQDATAIVTPLPSPLTTERPRRATASPLSFADGTQVSAPPASKRKWLVAGGLGAVVLVAGIVFAIGRGGDSLEPEPSVSAGATGTSRPATAAEPTAAEPRPARTWANSEKSEEPTPTEPTPIDPAGGEPAVGEPSEPEPSEPEPAVAEPIEPAVAAVDVPVEPEPIEPEPEPEPEPTKPATKPAAKSATKPAAKSASQPATKRVTKPATKRVTKPATKKPTKTPAPAPGWDPNSLFPKKK